MQMNLDPETRRFLDLAAAAGRPELWTLDARTARALADPLSEASEHLPEEVFQVSERSIPGPAGELPVRIYRPRQTAEPLPVLIYYHGGGFVVCNLDTHDSVCRTLANRSGCVIVSVGYRLSPETKFPGAFDDAYAAAAWVSGNAAELGVDPARLAVGGDSAGGTLAATVTHLARDRGGPPIAFQLLNYPATDAGRTPDRYPSYRDYSEGYFLTRRLMAWFAAQHMRSPADAWDPRLSPLRSENFLDLPPAFVATAGFDPLRDEGRAYAKALAEAHVPVVHHCYETTIHGFFSMGRFLPSAMEALADCAHQLRNRLGIA